jgi:hypothetical protein
MQHSVNQRTNNYNVARQIRATASQRQQVVGFDVILTILFSERVLAA